MSNEISTIMIAAGCNRDPETASWSHALDLVVYAASSTLIVYDPNAMRALAAVRGHNTEAVGGGRVNSVRWLARLPNGVCTLKCFASRAFRRI